jgi:hypothetical protein
MRPLKIPSAAMRKRTVPTMTSTKVKADAGRGRETLEREKGSRARITVHFLLRLRL